MRDWGIATELDKDGELEISYDGCDHATHYMWLTREQFEQMALAFNVALVPLA